MVRTYDIHSKLEFDFEEENDFKALQSDQKTIEDQASNVFRKEYENHIMAGEDNTTMRVVPALLEAYQDGELSMETIFIVASIGLLNLKTQAKERDFPSKVKGDSV